MNFCPTCGAVVALDGNPDLEDRVRRGLRGEFNAGRYGLPFLGDNAFLLDRMEELSAPPEAHWYERVMEASPDGPRPRTTRLTILIDRADLSAHHVGTFRAHGECHFGHPRNGLDGDPPAGRTAPTTPQEVKP